MPFTLIAGPCAIESMDILIEVGARMKGITDRLGIHYVLKASYDKANRSAKESFRGPGIEKGLAIIAEAKERLGVPIITDIHESYQAAKAAEVADVIQIPAYLCRQTDLLLAAGDAVRQTTKAVNVKKGQFLAPWDMKYVTEKLRSGGAENIWLTERGTSFGYNELVVDYRSLPQLRELGHPVIFDATHTVQRPGRHGSSSGGEREFIAPLARAAMAVGVDGLFMEVHPEPDEALSDGPCMLELDAVEPLLEQLVRIKRAVDPSSIAQVRAHHQQTKPLHQ